MRKRGTTATGGFKSFEAAPDPAAPVFVGKTLQRRNQVLRAEPIAI